ncbi:hypothetical protein ACFXDE_10140 [Kitasatospora sp. NPDC059408]|uniref:hypothetical protein n=1 Tax=Kitasatospora sp. NPDC059408 TaxID=3346823 RepID=UPI00369C87B1
MSTAPNLPVPPNRPDEAHPLRTIREIRASLPGDQVEHFDAELADTDIDELPAVLHRWATLGTDGFVDFLLSAPLEGLEFGARSYDDEAGPGTGVVAEPTARPKAVNPAEY